MAAERKYSDSQLREVVRSSSSYKMAAQRLGIGIAGRSYQGMRKRIDALELDQAHLQRRTSWTDDELRDTVPMVTSFQGLAEKLGIKLHGGAEKSLRNRARFLGLDTGHFVRTFRDGRVRRATWTDEDLRRAVASSSSVAGVLRQLGLFAEGGNYDRARRQIRDLGLDTSHFTGQGWNVGLKFVPRPAQPLQEVLVANRWTSSHWLKMRLFEAGLKEPKCELCGWAERSADGRIPLELDHINGDRNDNRLNNLRILCPNCHSLQPTHRGLNQRRAIEQRARSA